MSAIKAFYNSTTNKVTGYYPDTMIYPEDITDPYITIQQEEYVTGIEMCVIDGAYVACPVSPELALSRAKKDAQKLLDREYYSAKSNTYIKPTPTTTISTSEGASDVVAILQSKIRANAFPDYYIAPDGAELNITSTVQANFIIDKISVSIDNFWRTYFRTNQALILNATDPAILNTITTFNIPDFVVELY